MRMSLLLNTKILNNVIKFYVFLTFIFSFSIVVSQDIYNLENSRKYASHLYQNKEYNFAVIELQRVIFLDSTDIDSKIKLIKSFRHLQNYEAALQYCKKWYPEIVLKDEYIKNEIFKEYYFLLILNSSFAEAQMILDSARFINLEDKNNLQICLLIYEKKYAESQKFASQNKDSLNENLYLIAMSKPKRKIPFLAASLSTLVPGSGKIYAQRGRDGLFSLFLVSINSWSSYRAYQKKGIENLYTLFFGGMAVTFYAANIYGSYKQAINYNQKHVTEKEKQVYIFLYDNI